MVKGDVESGPIVRGTDPLTPPPLTPILFTQRRIYAN